MRAKEFTINIPINIKINDSGDPEISVDGKDNSTPQSNPVMVSPQQQEIELAKAALGKTSPVIDKLIQSDNIGSETAPEADEASLDDQLLQRLRSLIT